MVLNYLHFIANLRKDQQVIIAIHSFSHLAFIAKLISDLIAFDLVIFFIKLSPMVFGLALPISSNFQSYFPEFLSSLIIHQIAVLYKDLIWCIENHQSFICKCLISLAYYFFILVKRPKIITFIWIQFALLKFKV